MLPILFGTIALLSVLTMPPPVSALAEALPPRDLELRSAQAPRPDPVISIWDPILLLAGTAIVEGVVLLLLARLRKKPTGWLVLASIIGNIITVIPLTAGLGLGWFQGVSACLSAEIGVWLVEAAVLRFFPRTQASWKEALLYSGVMNLCSLGAGAAAVRLP